MVRRLKYAVTLVVALLFMASLAAAQQKDDYGGAMDARDHGYQHGYRDGLRQGRADLNNNARPSYDSEDYRRADLGFEDYMGDRHAFQDGYREGYKSGYEDGYQNRPVRSDIYGLKGDTYDPDRVPRSDRDAEGYPNWGTGDVAFDTGYRDGLGAGQKDLRDRKDYRPEKHDSFEDADHGYRRNYGSKDDYKQAYKKGFLRGYEDAFNRRER